MSSQRINTMAMATIIATNRTGKNLKHKRSKGVCQWRYWG
jgi:hypothetical protein